MRKIIKALQDRGFEAKPNQIVVANEKNGKYVHSNDPALTKWIVAKKNDVYVVITLQNIKKLGDSEACIFLIDTLGSFIFKNADLHMNTLGKQCFLLPMEQNHLGLKF